MQQSILIEGITRDEFLGFMQRLESYFAITPLPQEKYLTRKETAERLQVSLPTLNELTKSGRLKGYRLGGNVRYKASEVEASLEMIITSKYRQS